MKKPFISECLGQVGPQRNNLKPTNDVCPIGFRNVGSACIKPSPYLSNKGYATEELCENSGARGAKNNRCSDILVYPSNNFQWYPDCEPNFIRPLANTCNPQCPFGWTDNGSSCTKPLNIPCPTGFRDMGAYCIKPSYFRGKGHTTQQECLNSNDHGAKQNGCEQYTHDETKYWIPKCDAGFSANKIFWNSCYKDCPTNFRNDDGLNTTCIKPSSTNQSTDLKYTSKPNGLACPTGFLDQGNVCLKPAVYSTPHGYDTRQECENSGERGAKKNGCYRQPIYPNFEHKWYPACDQGFLRTHLDTCYPYCPAGWTDDKSKCIRP